MRREVSQVNTQFSIVPVHRGMGQVTRYRPDPEYAVMTYAGNQGPEIETITDSVGDGMGLLPLVAAAPAAGPGAPIVLAVAGIGTAISKLFGFGGDDQKTNYRPPSNSAQVPVSVGGVNIAFDMNDLRLAMARGNRAEDLYSYYSAFVSNSVDAGASQAAKKVILDTAARYGVSIAYAAASILTTAGVRRIDYPSQQAPTSQGFLASQPPPSPSQLDTIIANILKSITGIFTPKPGGTTAPTGPPGTTQPQQPPGPAQPPAGATPPIAGGGGVPASVQQALLQQAINAAATLGTALAQQLLNKKMQIASQAAAAGCDPAAQYYDPYTNSCVFLVPCPQDQYFEPLTGQCQRPTGAGNDLQSLLNSLGSIGGIPIWLLILLALALASSSGGDDGSVVAFRTRRRRR